ncbi:class I SAM-dependent methyltransferase [Piscibacillus halophilus]|uniref:class I SAM-dependent methyltransferase n=1 Tax=Piscibacillus halophilus TaxID=571933 RepID=UPI00158D8347|nr:class I SAM-dependent methyltransferase [Piscibacillus halophilus]
MKTTDFSKIANQYDDNPFRKQELEVDQDLLNLLKKRNEAKVLDLSCGTGLYLEKQMSFFKNQPIEWFGLDKSKDMLDYAKEKVLDAHLHVGVVEDIPFASETFDYIVNNYAFHHYQDKPQALNEITRVLKKGGRFKIHNIAIHDMPLWWVYQYFPQALEEDLNRFWPKEKLFKELTERGFEVEIKVEYRMQKIKLKDYLFYADNRDISVLILISDDDYKLGLNNMKTDLKHDSNHEITVDFAVMNVLARKKG